MMSTIDKTQGQLEKQGMVNGLGKQRSTTVDFKFHLPFGPATQESTLWDQYQKRVHVPTQILVNMIRLP